jgi:hypothetical protein
MEVTVVSYNMSVFSAMGYAGDDVKLVFGKGKSRVNNKGNGIFPSEARFLRRAKLITDEKDLFKGTSTFFKNAVAHLHKNASGAAVIGIQEFHPPTFDLIMFGFPGYASHIFSKSITNDAKVLTIWDKTKFGEMSTAYDEDLGIGPEPNSPADKGRPISIITTDKGYVLINFHGINRPRVKPDGSPTNQDNSERLKQLLEYHVGKAELTVDPNNIVIMCDSNDREGKLIPLNLLGVEFKLGTNDGNIKSCCYNYDSCGIDVAPAGVPQDMGELGAESKYAYPGDYVLGTHPKLFMVINSPQDENGASIASDHKLVKGVLELPLAGGYRRRRKTYKKKRTHRKSKSRHNRRR